MRTTLELREDIATYLQERSSKERRTFKDVTNEVLYLGIGRQSGTAATWTCPAYQMGRSSFVYEQAWATIDGLEADAMAEKLDLLK